MSRSFIGRMIITVAVLGGIIGALTFIAPPALAANHRLATNISSAFIATTPALTPTPTPALTPTPTPALTPTPTPGTGNAATAAFQVPGLVAFLLILLAFGLVVIGGLLIYVYNIQMKYYTAAQSLSQLGVGVKATLISSIVSPGFVVDKGKKLAIDGPGFIAVGAQADFAAKIDSNESSADTQWASAPDGAVSLNTDKGPKVTVTPLKIGSFTLTAKDANQTVEVSVAVVAPQATTEELPFIGQGFGSLVIAVLVVVALILLGLTGVLTGETVGTLLGGLLGYIFGVTTSSAAASKKTDSKLP